MQFLQWQIEWNTFWPMRRHQTTIQLMFQWTTQLKTSFQWNHSRCCFSSFLSSLLFEIKDKWKTTAKPIFIPSSFLLKSGKITSRVRIVCSVFRQFRHFRIFVHAHFSYFPLSTLRHERQFFIFHSFPRNRRVLQLQHASHTHNFQFHSNSQRSLLVCSSNPKMFYVWKVGVDVSSPPKRKIHFGCFVRSNAEANTRHEAARQNKIETSLEAANFLFSSKSVRIDN